MKVEMFDGRAEREVLTGMIVDKAVIASIAPKWNGKLFGSRFSNLLGGMAVQYFMKYNKPPGRDIQSLMDAWEQNHPDDRDTAKAADRLLTALDDEHDRNQSQLNSAYVLDKAEELFTSVKLRELRDQIDAGLQTGGVAEVRNLVQNFRPVEVSAAAGVNLLSDPAAVKRAFDTREGAIVRWGQRALDDFFEESLERDAFIAFEGKEKVGKSFWLQELVWLSINQKRRTAFFEVGDQSQNQIIRRLAARAAGRPFRADARVRVPVSIDPGPPVEVTHDERSFDSPMTWEEARKAFGRAAKDIGPDLLKLSVHPNSSVSALGIEAVIDGWDRDGWVPDVVVIDYVDILAPINGKDDTRDQINATWKALRRLSQQLHCLVVTATQSDAASYNTNTLSRQNFSEDKRKHSHVTGMVGINQTSTEKKDGLYRLNWIVGRDLEFAEDKCVFAAACLPLANPAVLSSF